LNPKPPEYRLIKERCCYANPLHEGLSEHGHGMLVVFVELSSCQYLMKDFSTSQFVTDLASIPAAKERAWYSPQERIQGMYMA
jgi:hypothetical protein